MSAGSAALQPTFTGHVATTTDALILFEACLTGQLSHVPRRPHDRERSLLIRSGCVFIYEENASGIKRWTDGVTWSPSRILGNFLVYRELDKPFPPGEKKRAMKKNGRVRPNRPGEPYPRHDGNGPTYSPTTPAALSFTPERTPNDMERSLIGSLVDSYGFKSDGLVKKTMSVTVQGVTHHLVSYYNVSDVVGGHLRTPSQTETLHYVRPRLELTSKQSFRSPLEDNDDLDGMREHAMNTQAAYGYRAPPVNHPGYLSQSNSYYTSSMYTPNQVHPVSSNGYASNQPAAISGSYVPSTIPNLNQRDNFAPYPPSFTRPFESLNPSIPPSSAAQATLPSTASMPSSLNIRPQQPQAQPHSVPTSVYPTPQRSLSTHSPAPLNTPDRNQYRSSQSGAVPNTNPPGGPVSTPLPTRRRSTHHSPSMTKSSPHASDINTNGGSMTPVSLPMGYSNDRSQSQAHFYMNGNAAAHHAQMGSSAYHGNGGGMATWAAPTPT